MNILTTDSNDLKFGFKSLPFIVIKAPILPIVSLVEKITVNNFIYDIAI